MGMAGWTVRNSGRSCERLLQEDRAEQSGKENRGLSQRDTFAVSAKLNAYKTAPKLRTDNAPAARP